MCIVEPIYCAHKFMVDFMRHYKPSSTHNGHEIHDRIKKYHSCIFCSWQLNCHLLLYTNITSCGIFAIWNMKYENRARIHTFRTGHTQQHTTKSKSLISSNMYYRKEEKKIVSITETLSKFNKRAEKKKLNCRQQFKASPLEKKSMRSNGKWNIFFLIPNSTLLSASTSLHSTAINSIRFDSFVDFVFRSLLAHVIFNKYQYHV